MGATGAKRPMGAELKHRAKRRHLSDIAAAAAADAISSDVDSSTPEAGSPGGAISGAAVQPRQAGGVAAAGHAANGDDDEDDYDDDLSTDVALALGSSRRTAQHRAAATEEGGEQHSLADDDDGDHDGDDDEDDDEEEDDNDDDDEGTEDFEPPQMQELDGTLGLLRPPHEADLHEPADPRDLPLAAGAFARPSPADGRHMLHGPRLIHVNKLLSRIFPFVKTPGAFLWRSRRPLTDAEWQYVQDALRHERLGAALEGQRVMAPLPEGPLPDKLGPCDSDGQRLQGPFAVPSGAHRPSHDIGRQYFCHVPPAALDAATVPGDGEMQYGGGSGGERFIWADGVQPGEPETYPGLFDEPAASMQGGLCVIC